MNEKDVQAYLCVLGYPPPGNHKENIPGCLCRIEEQLLPLTYDNKAYRSLYDLLKYREKLNGYLPQEDVLLWSATRLLATVFQGYLIDHFKR